LIRRGRGVHHPLAGRGVHGRACDRVRGAAAPAPATVLTMPERDWVVPVGRIRRVPQSTPRRCPAGAACRGVEGRAVTRKMGIRWHLRLRMAEKGLFQTSDLVPLLAERGIHLSREQVYRLVTQVPQRLSTDTLAALCDILKCQPNDLIEVEVVSQQVRKVAGEPGRAAPPPVRRSTIRRPDLS
jgi:DNA-binding Xre family transcriptional regulator